MEARERGFEVKAAFLISDFSKKFRSIEFTVHPSDIPNEAPGKSSNISWAARQASERYNHKMRKDVTITVMDGMISIIFLRICIADRTQLIATCPRIISS
jgi:hypothetical protein